MWIGRAVLWALIIVILVNGIRAPIERFTATDTPSTAPSQSPDSEFPLQQAAAFANQFAAIYLNFDGTNPAQRDERLTGFLAEGVERRFGWNGYGRMSAGAIQFDSVDVQDADNAVVKVSFQSGSKRWLLSIPVYHSGERFVVSAFPALLPAPGPADMPAIGDPERDTALEAQLEPTLKGFFQAYASSDSAQLQLYAADGAGIQGLGGAFTLSSLSQVIVPLLGETSKKVVAEVVWAVPSGGDATAAPDDPAAQPAGLEQRYQLTMEKQGEKWLVKQIQGASRSVG